MFCDRWGNGGLEREGGLVGWWVEVGFKLSFKGFFEDFMWVIGFVREDI